MRILARTKAGRAVAEAPDRLAPRGSKGPEEGRFGGYFTPSAGTPHPVGDTAGGTSNASSVFSPLQIKGYWPEFLAQIAKPRQRPSIQATSFGRLGVARLPLFGQFFLFGRFCTLLTHFSLTNC